MVGAVVLIVGSCSFGIKPFLIGLADKPDAVEIVGL